MEGKHRGHKFLSLEESKGLVTETLRTSIETIEIEEPTLRDIESELTEDANEHQKRSKKLWNMSNNCLKRLEKCWTERKRS